MLHLRPVHLFYIFQANSRLEFDISKVNEPIWELDFHANFISACQHLRHQFAVNGGTGN